MKNAIGILFVWIVLLATREAPGATITVTTTADSGPGSLRQALASAAAGDTINFSVSGTITLSSGELLIDKNLTITGPGAGNLSLERSPAAGTGNFRILHIASGIVSISGLTMSNGRETAGGGIQNETTTTLLNCVVTSNAATQTAGGINNLSTLTLTDCVVSANTVVSNGGAVGGGLNNEGTLVGIHCNISSNIVSGGNGGGINNNGTLSLTNSTVNANGASGAPNAIVSGGGLFNEGTLILDTTTVGFNAADAGFLGGAQGGGLANDLGTVTVVRSTISGNVASGGQGSGKGGGLANGFGTMILENSTISGNTATGTTNGLPGDITTGGGIWNGVGSLTINHTTIAANSVPALAGGLSGLGGGLFDAEGIVAIKNTIVAANTPADLAVGTSADIESGGFNLFGSTNAPIAVGTSDQFNITAAMLKIGPLQNNGGPTFTHALLCGSPAINAGDNAGAPPTDQRGFPRIVGGTIDIGSFEFSDTPPAVTCPAPVVLNCAPVSGKLATLTATVTDVDGDPLMVVWTVNGTALQTNSVPAGGPPTSAQVSFSAVFPVGTNQVTLTVLDSSECMSTCATTVTVSSAGGPTIHCPDSVTVGCAPPGGREASLSVLVGAPDGSPLLVMFSVNGTPVQTNVVPAGPAPTSAQVPLTSFFVVGTNLVSVSVSDTNGCVASCSSTVEVVALGNVYPIALSLRNVTGVPVGTILPDIYNGVQPGNFGWLTWRGSPSEPTLVTSLTPPGNSDTYINPFDRADHVISIGDWVQGKPGVSNSDQVRKALDVLEHIDIVVPVWDRAKGRGNNSLYRVAAFARVRIINYHLPQENRITARFLGLLDCK